MQYRQRKVDVDQTLSEMKSKMTTYSVCAIKK